MRSSFVWCALGVGLAAGLGCGGAQPGSFEPCGGPDVCAAGVCVAGRCRTKSPAPVTASRVVLYPADFAAVTANSEDRAGIPESIALGQEAAGRAVVLFRFVAPWRDDAQITAAHLIFDPIDGAPAPLRPPEVEVAKILSDWTGATTSWGRMPRLGLPSSAGKLRVTGDQPVRVDVTVAVRSWVSRDADDHGIAVLVAGEDPNGMLASTGLTEGTAPHLEVYIKPSSEPWLAPTTSPAASAAPTADASSKPNASPPKSR